MQMVQVTVAPNRRLTLCVNGFLFVYQAGDTPMVPVNEVAVLRRSKVIV